MLSISLLANPVNISQLEHIMSQMRAVQIFELLLGFLTLKDRDQLLLLLLLQLVVPFLHILVVDSELLKVKLSQELLSGLLGHIDWEGDVENLHEVLGAQDLIDHSEEQLVLVEMLDHLLDAHESDVRLINQTVVHVSYSFIEDFVKRPLVLIAFYSHVPIFVFLVIGEVHGANVHVSGRHFQQVERLEAVF